MSSSHTSPVSAFGADLAAVALFGLFARVAHQTAEMPLTFLGWLDTTWPFWVGCLLGWLVLWFALAGKATGHELRAGFPVWGATVFVGLLVWGIRHGAVPHWSFMIVASVMGAVLLFGWRGLRRVIVREPTSR